MTQVLLADIYYAKRVKLTPEQLGLQSFPDFEEISTEDWADLVDRAKEYLTEVSDPLPNEIEIWADEESPVDPQEESERRYMQDAAEAELGAPPWKGDPYRGE